MSKNTSLSELRASIRERLCRAIAGDEGQEALAAGQLIVPIDAAILETGYLLAELLAKHPNLRSKRLRAKFLEKIGFEAQALIEGGVSPAKSMATSDLVMQ